MSRPSYLSRYLSALLLVTPLTLAFMSHGCSGGGTPEPTSTPTPTPVPETIQAIGTVSESEVAFVGKLATSSGAAASGVLIAPQYFVTAAHNVSDSNRNVQKPFSITFAGTPYTVSSNAQVKINPNYNGVSFAPGDIAVVKLDSPVTGVTPATRYSGTDEIGKQAVYRGFGVTKNPVDGGKLGYNIIDGTANQLNPLNILTIDFDDKGQRIKVTDATPLCLITDQDNNTTEGNTLSSIGSSATPMPQEFVLTRGDSGGGLLIRINKGLRLVGIGIDLATYSNNPGNDIEDDYGRVSSYTRISAYNTWIDSNVN